MKRIAYLLLLFVSAFAGSSEAIIVQQFDSSGSPVATSRRPLSDFSAKIKKYPVPEGVELRRDVKYEFYPVFGRTFAEIIRSAEENGPVNSTSKRRSQSAYAWRFGWSFSYTYDLEEDDDNPVIHCDIIMQDITLNYDIVITLPALTDDSALNTVEKELWKGHIRKLVEQEHDHAKVIKDDTEETLKRRLGEITYLQLGSNDAMNAEKTVERYIRTEAEKIAKETSMQIQQKLGPTEKEQPRRDTFPSRRR